MKTIKTNKFISTLSVAVLALSLAGCAPAETESEPVIETLQITDGWVRVSEMSAAEGGMTGAFAVFTNTSEEDITLIAGESDVAGKVEIHEVVDADGEMTMQQIDGGIKIPAGESVTLEPGGLHVMLMMLTRGLTEGEDISITLKFDGHPDVAVSWPTRSAMAGDEDYDPMGGSEEDSGN